MTASKIAYALTKEDELNWLALRPIPASARAKSGQLG